MTSLFIKLIEEVRQIKLQLETTATKMEDEIARMDEDERNDPEEIKEYIDDAIDNLSNI